MKTPTARKLPSGAWTCRVRAGGKDISITRPTEKAAVAEAMAIKAGVIEASRTSPSAKTMREAIDDYISARSAVLSPSTIRGYRIIQNNRFQGIMDRPLKSLSDIDFQRAVNRESRECGAKTVKNAWGLIRSAVQSETGRTVTVRLPQVAAKERPFLQPEQIPIFLDAIHGHRYEIPMLLGLHGLRASEILALHKKDIDTKKSLIHINGSAVLDETGALVQKKTNKNTSSRRVVPILIPRLKELVETANASPDDLLCSAPNGGALYKAVMRVCEKAELPIAGPHGLRHSFASLCYHLGIPEAVTMKLGGWSNPGTMRKIYTHLADQDLRRDADKLFSFFQSPPGAKNDGGNDDENNVQNDNENDNAEK